MTAMDVVRRLVLILLFAVFVGAGFSRIMAENAACKSWETVIEIGACDRYGSCGVRYQSGAIGEASKPIIGSRVCVSRFAWWESQP